MTGMPPRAPWDNFARQHLPPPDALPEFLFERPGLQSPARLNRATEGLDHWGEGGQGDRLCIQGAGLRWTCAEPQASIAPCEYLREIESRAGLPRTETGKPQRFRLHAP